MSTAEEKWLDEIEVRHVAEFKRKLTDAGLAGKTITNIVGLLHQVFGDAVEEGLIENNPVRRITSARARRGQQQRSGSQPLLPEEVARFLQHVTAEYRGLYGVWFRVGWRSSEIVALRWEWLDFRRQVVAIKRGRMPLHGGIEAEPKTGPRTVDCSYDPEIFGVFARLREESTHPVGDGFVFTHREGEPMSQEWLHERVWLPTLERAGI